MSAISDKLSYLDVTRSKIKDTINYTGAGITESDTFRSYARTLKDSFVDIINDGTGTLYDNFPKATDEGSNTTLNNVYEAPMELEVEGKSEQDSYSGKNYANTNKDPDWVYQNTVWTRSGSNVTVKNSDTSIYAFVEYYIDNLKPNTTYTISFDVTISVGVCSIDVQKARDNSLISNRLLKLDSSTSGHLSGQFTTPSDTSAMSINLYSLRGTYYENASVEYSNVQIEEGSSETSYEPYVGGIPSPSPDYPQEIKSVSGIENLLNLDTTSYGYINDSGNVAGTGSHINRLTDYIRFDENMTVSLSTTIYGIGYALFDENKNYLSRVSKVADISKYTISSSSAKYIRIWFNYDSSSDTTIELLSNLKAMIESGTTPHTPVPYGHWLPIKVENKNLFDINGNINTSGRYGSQTSYNSVSNGILTTTVNSSTTHSVGQKYTNLNGKTITFSADVVSVGTSSNVTPKTGIAIYDNGTFIASSRVYGIVGDRITTTYTCTSNNIVCGFLTLQGTGGQYKNIQVEISNEKTDYIEYQEQTTLIDLNKYDGSNNIIGNYELCSIGDVKDTLTIENGVAKITKNIGKMIFNGNETWSIGSQTYNGLHYFNTPSITDFKRGQTGITLNTFKASHFHYVPSANRSNLGGSYFINDMFLVFMNFATIVDFKTWLSTHNTEVYYALATPETITLKGTYNVKTYEDVTHISIDDDLEPNMIASGLTWE